MTVCNQADFAAKHGVSAQALRHWKKKGWLVFNADRLVEIEQSDALVARYRHVDESKAVPGRRGRPPSKPSVPAKVDLTAADCTDEMPSTDGMDVNEARRFKEIYLARRIKLQHEKDSAASVDLAAAKTLFFQASRGARESWIRWPAEVGPLLAATLGVESDAIVEALNLHVHRHLKSLGEPQFVGLK